MTIDSPIEITSGHARNAKSFCARFACLVALAGFLLVAAIDAGARDHGSRFLNSTRQAKSKSPQTLQAPTASLSLAPDTILAAPDPMTPGGTSALAILLSNPNTDVFSGTVNNVQFSMSNVPVAPGGLLENTCGASLVVTATSVQLTDGTLQAAGSCVIIVNLAGNAPGQVALDTGPITSSNAPAGSAAAATLTVASGTLLAAPGAETTFAPNLISIGGTTQLTIRLTNHDANNAVTGVQLFDIYPFGITNAPSALVSNTCGGGLTLRGPNPDFDLLLIGGTIPAGGQCSLVVNVVGTDESFPSNFVTVGPFGNAPTPNGPSATIHVVTDPLLGAPSAVEQFVPPTVAVGASSAMTVQLTNNNNTPINGTQFNEHYPSGFSNTSSAVVSTNTCGGTLTADANGNMLSLANGVIPAAATCTITVNVVGNAQGSWFSQTGAIVSSNAFEGSTAVGGLSVTGSVSLAAPTVSKDFSPQSIAVGDTSTLTLTLTNNDANTAVTGVQLSDPYPGGMANASSAVLVSNSCGGSVTAPTSGFSMSLSGGTIPAAGSCQIKLHVVGTAPGAAINQTEPATSANADPGNPATATLTVTGGGGATPQSISFTSTAPNNAFVGGPTYHATASATSGLPVALTIDAASINVCTIANGTVSFIGSGICTIDANQSGDATYAPAPQMPQTFAVAAAGGATQQSIQFTSSQPANAVVGGSAYAVTAIATSGLTVTLTIDAASASVCSINNGSVSFIGVGSCTIDANQGGNATYAPAPQVQQSFTVSPGGVFLTPQDITFTSAAPNGAVVAGPGYSPIATASSGLSVTMTIDAASAIVCTISGGNVSFIGAGTCTIDANQGGDATFAPAPQKQQSVTVGSAGGVTAQTISFTSMIPANAKVGGATYLATATATSGLPVVLTIEASSATVCKISAMTVTFIGAGTCTIDANQGGNATYAAAPEMQQSFAVVSAGGVTPQAITFTSNAPVNAHVAGTSYFATAVANSGLPTVLTIANASATVCTISNGWVSFIGAGTCTIYANQGGDATYAPAAQAQQQFAVASGGGATSQTINFISTPPANATVGGPSYLAMATATSGLPVVMTIDAASSAVCTINYGTVLFIGAGACKVDANQGGDATYAPAPQAQQSINVGTGGGGGNHAPIAVDDAIQVARGAASNVLIGDTATPSSVLDNDFDADNDPLSASKLSNPQHGDLTFNSNGTFSYQSHQNDQATSDSFTYVACDTHAVCVAANVTITIGTGLNDHAPFATDDAIQVAAGSSTTALVGDPKSIDSVLDNDVDLDGDALTASNLSDPSHGTLSFNADGTFTYNNDPSDLAPSDSFLYEACDDFGACALGVVSITIGNQPQDHAPIVIDDAIQVPHGSTAHTLIGDANDPGSVLDNDHDPDAGDTLAAAKVGPLLNNSGDITLNADGTFSYQNVDQQATTDSFVYEACDSFFACTPGIVTISINDNPPDVAPVAMNDAIVVAPHGSTGTLVGDATNVLTNDTDPGDTLTAHLISAPVNGHVTLNTDGTFTYFNDDPAPGVDSWMYEACDSYGACSGATVSVTVSGSAPTVTCLLPTQVNSVGDTVSIDLSLLFAPPAGQTLTYGATSVPPSLSVVGSLLTGTLQPNDAPPAPPYTYTGVLTATSVPGSLSASENVTFQVLPTGEVLLRDGFDGGQVVQPPCQ